jgi:phosphoribosylcarboxyaminoimidazole (NCAIR) mutase
MTRDMKNWLTRFVVIIAVAGLVAAVLPGIKQRMADEPTPSGSIGLLQVPDRGSLLVGAVVAIALLRVFVTIDRRARR